MRMIAILLVCIGIGTVALVGVYTIPVDKIDTNVQESVYIFEHEGTYPSVSAHCMSKLDNWTDSIMLLNALYSGQESVIEKSMVVYHQRVHGKNPTESLINYYAEEEEWEEMSVRGYARYWHGYLIFLKPLLMCMNYGTLRIVNLVIQTILNIVLAVILYRKKLSHYIIPYLLSVCLIMPLTTAYSLQFSSVFYIFTIGSIILLWKNDKWKGTEKYLYFFLILGILTSYFDFLTYPVATLGVPLIFFICLNKETRIVKNIVNIIVYSCSWGIGYIGMWAGKWLVATALTQENIIVDAFKAIGTRSSMSDSAGVGISFFEVLYRNIGAFIENPLMLGVLLYILVCLAVVIKKKLHKEFFECVIVFGVVGLFPFVWYFYTSNHSYIHFWFTYKDLIITAFACMCICAKTLEMNVKK